MSSLEEVELAKLKDAVETAKKLLGLGEAGSRATSVLVTASLTMSEHRIEFLEQEIDGESSERSRRENEKNQNLVVGYLVQREIHLSSIEREQFAGFLESSFFTKADFEDLNEFYGSAYDRLSERGKAELSIRIWNGVREEEYEFRELPEKVREKEMERLLGLLSDPVDMPDTLKRIPATERKEFIDAMAKEDHERALNVLGSESFRKNVSLRSEVAVESRPVEPSEGAKEAVVQNSYQGETEKVTHGIPDSASLSGDWTITR